MLLQSCVKKLSSLFSGVLSMLARSVRAVAARVTTRTFAAIPLSERAGVAGDTVEDVTVRVTFIDAFGERRTVPGLVGTSLYNVATAHGMELGPTSEGHETVEVKERWTEDMFGEGVSTAWDHIQVTNEWLKVTGPANAQERKVLEDVWGDEAQSGSRLASQVILTKEMDGLVTYVPDTMPW